MWTCDNCDERVEDDFDVCWNCETQKGEIASSQLAFAKSQPIIDEQIDNTPRIWECEACGAEVGFEDTTCPTCGADITEVAAGIEEAIIQNKPAPMQKQATKSSATNSKQVSAIIKRYKDAYAVARGTNGFGVVIKASGMIIGGLLVLIGFLVTSSSRPRDPMSILGIIGIAAGIIVGVLFFIIGVLVSAQGQILKASLDSAVNSSPFLRNEHRAEIMSMPKS